MKEARQFREALFEREAYVALPELSYACISIEKNLPDES